MGRLKAFGIPLVAAALIAFCASAPHDASAAHKTRGMVTVMHYFAGVLGREALNQIFHDFQEKHHIAVFDNPIGHEDFKTELLEMAAEGLLPDMLGNWAGARTQTLVDRKALRAIDEFWDSNHIGDLVVPVLAKQATLYDDHRYLIPFGYHCIGFFYNPGVLARIGVTTFPATWPEFLDLGKRLVKAGIVPVSLGSRNRWPAQFWFDFILLRTAGPEFRARLMMGKEPYSAPEVRTAVRMWKDLLEAGIIVDKPEDDWTDAADAVADGTAAMTLMGTWIDGYWLEKNIIAARDYDFAEFPAVDPAIPRIALGPVDGFVISANARNPENAEALALFLLGNSEAQSNWAKAQGALSPNVDMNKTIYDAVQRRAHEAVATADAFAFNYDLSTPPAVAELGLDFFRAFLDLPERYLDLLHALQSDAATAFGAASAP